MPWCCEDFAMGHMANQGRLRKQPAPNVSVQLLQAVSKTVSILPDAMRGLRLVRNFVNKLLTKVFSTLVTDTSIALRRSASPPLGDVCDPLDLADASNVCLQGCEPMRMTEARTAVRPAHRVVPLRYRSPREVQRQ